MKPNAHMEEIHKSVLKQFHTLCSLNGLGVDEKKSIVHSYGVQSSADMQTHDLIDVCGTLQKQLDAKNGTSNKRAEMDKIRKRCLKAICTYIDAKGVNTTNKLEYAKKMACRASKKKDFNKLTAAELRGVIGYFNKERETMERAARNLKLYSPEVDEITALSLVNIQPIGEA